MPLSETGDSAQKNYHRFMKGRHPMACAEKRWLQPPELTASRALAIFFQEICRNSPKATVPGRTERDYALLTRPKKVGMLQDLVGVVSRGPERTTSPVSSVEAIFYFFPNDA